MGNGNPSDDDKEDQSPTSGERRLRDYEKRRNPDTELRVDGEDDSLYDDGLDTEDDDDETLAGTRGPSSGIKP